MSNPIAMNMDQFKDVDAYLLKDYESISDDGKLVMCTNCGTARYERKHSVIAGKDYWSYIEKEGRYLIPHLSGCRCQQKARHRISEIRDGRWKDSIDPKNGNNLQEWVEGNHSDIVYNTKRYTFSIPKSYIGKSVESSDFWELSGESQNSYQRIRNMLEEAFISGDVNNRFFIHGDWHATAMMCAMRNSFIQYGIPAILMDTKTILFHMSQDTPMAPELEKVPMLLIMFTEKLSKTGSEILHRLMEARGMRGLDTMFSAESSFDDVCCDWISEELVVDIFGCISNESNSIILSSNNEDVPF